MIVVPDGRSCPCGNRGCLERYVSLQAAYEALEIGDLAHATPQMLLDPSPVARARLDGWLDEAAQRLRQAVNILESMLDAEAVVIGGFLPSSVLALLIERLEPLLTSVAARRNRGMQRLLVRGVEKVKSIALWFAIAHNVACGWRLRLLCPAVLRAPSRKRVRGRAPSFRELAPFLCWPRATAHLDWPEGHRQSDLASATCRR